MKRVEFRIVTTILGAILLTAGLAQLTGCGNGEDSAKKAQANPQNEASLEPSRGFSWIVPGQLAAMPVPGRDRPLDQDAAFLEQEGVRVLVSLTEEPPDGQVLASRAIDQEHIPLQDYQHLPLSR